MLPPMVVLFRRLWLAVSLAAVAPAALASDYVVVRSSEPAIVRGQSFDAGDRVAIGPGGALTLMHASGDIITLKGAPGGVSLPRRNATPRDADRMAVLRFIMSSSPPDASGRKSRTRGGICPAVESLVTLDQIVLVKQSGCPDEAARALEAYLASHGDENP